MCDNKRKIGIPNDAEIFETFRDDRFVFHVNPDDRFREQERCPEEKERQAYAAPHAERNQLFDGGEIVFTVVLGAQDHDTAAKADRGLLEQEVHLVDRGDARKRGLAVRADHDVVRQIDAERDHLLQDQHERHFEERGIERFISDHVAASHCMDLLISYRNSV